MPVADSTTIEFVMNLDQQSIATQIGMSPSARHIHPDILAERIATLPLHLEALKACLEAKDDTSLEQHWQETVARLAAQGMFQ